ncbi:MAG: DegT/DnrJ/EryC1/StrS family aminotransferase [Thermoplasmata archaeon]|nr:DegT/DnrJ/EryC1/StrS family aminotransferase [Thermoplasmata archaeon]MCJ7561463.1 DegT/DnrJ/EryC1/StrS family aminotransferase [Thermoplasmata archaeon]TFG68573.1 MAG: DegT/DnrJ/EryC1/StrS family aminotransferase [Methanomassiliicoccus sp.]
MKVPQAQPVMTEKMIEAAATALRTERLTLGDSVFKFEEAFAKMCGVDHAIALGSGTAALQLGLQAAGVKSGDKVLTSAMSFVATSNSFVAFGAKPVFCDVDAVDFNIDPAKIQLDKETKAIIPVHLYGHPAKMDEINEIAQKHDAVVVEDACQAHGARYKGRRAGSLGLMGCFSFYPTKNMHVGGDGGMITTNDPKIAEITKKLRHCGRKGQYEHDIIGYTARLNTANAAVGIEQLKLLDQWNDKRREIAKKYDQMLKGVGDLRLPLQPSNDFEPVYHQYSLLTKRRNELKAHLESKGIGVGVHYEIPIHLQPIYREMYGFKEGMLPITERLCKEVLTMPMFVDIEDEQIKYVVENIKGFYG